MLAADYTQDTGWPATFEVLDGPVPELAVETAQTLQRVAQEALTNARKHAPGAAVQVRLAVGAETVTLTIENAAPTTPTAPLANSGGGWGLIGLRERVGLVGGSVETGATAGGGFRVAAVVPGALCRGGRVRGLRRCSTRSGWRGAGSGLERIGQRLGGIGQRLEANRSARRQRLAPAPQSVDPVPQRVPHRLSPVAHPDLREQVVDVRLHGRGGDEQLLGDLGVRLAARDQRQYLGLARCEARQRPAPPRRRRAVSP